MPVVCLLALLFNPCMNKNLSIFIGLRYAFSKRQSGYLSFISVFSFLAMALGVMALIIVLSVMNGLIVRLNRDFESGTPYYAYGPSRPFICPDRKI